MPLRSDRLEHQTFSLAPPSQRRVRLEDLDRERATFAEGDGGIRRWCYLRLERQKPRLETQRCRQTLIGTPPLDHPQGLSKGEATGESKEQQGHRRTNARQR